jgi:hypothetical protein
LSPKFSGALGNYSYPSAKSEGKTGDLRFATYSLVEGYQAAPASGLL